MTSWCLHSSCYSGHLLNYTETQQMDCFEITFLATSLGSMFATFRRKWEDSINASGHLKSVLISSTIWVCQCQGVIFFQEKKKVPQKGLENKNILNLAAIATWHFLVMFLPKFWVSHFCMPMSSRCMSPYWLFENHPEIGLSLSINLSQMKAIKNPKTKKESRVRTQSSLWI